MKICVLCGWSFLNHFNHLKVSNCKDLTCLLTLFRVDQINCIDMCSILACKALLSTASGSGDSVSTPVYMEFNKLSYLNLIIMHINIRLLK